MKKPISATINEELITWITKKVEESPRFRNKSHVIETALDIMKQQESKKK